MPSPTKPSRWVRSFAITRLFGKAGSADERVTGLGHDQGIRGDVYPSHVEAFWQLVIGYFQLCEDVFVERDRRFSTAVTQMTDCAERRVLALLKHLILSVEPIRCGSVFPVYEDRVRAIHGGGEIHRLGAEVLKDRIDVVIDQEDRGNSLFGPELDLLL
jgi:hypothetical protein